MRRIGRHSRRPDLRDAALARSDPHGRSRRVARRCGAIAANNFQAAAGQTKGYFIVSNVSANTDLQSIDQFKRMIVKSRRRLRTRRGHRDDGARGPEHGC
jgi:hypothetical protein